ncbi:MAG: acetyl-CoA carboxylase biotin carboxyl carrier protein subunit [Clostridiales bacterium]|nr:acetyl-CoA carboxylase biotin carboxyl carrier protein subunit [Clostridiales bacterium]
MRKFNVTVNGKTYSVDVEEVGGESTATATPVAAAATAPAVKPVVGEGTPLKAPMPGLILSLAHKDGDTVKKNEKVVVLEAMKMENDVNAPAEGVITYVVKKGDNVDTGAILAYIK